MVIGDECESYDYKYLHGTIYYFLMLTCVSLVLYMKDVLLRLLLLSQCFPVYVYNIPGQFLVYVNSNTNNVCGVYNYVRAASIIMSN